MIGYLLAVMFVDTGVTQEYAFATKAQCEQAKKPVAELYAGLKQPVVLVCKPRVKSQSEVETSQRTSTITRHTYRVKTAYKF